MKERMSDNRLGGANGTGKSVRGAGKWNGADGSSAGADEWSENAGGGVGNVGGGGEDSREDQRQLLTTLRRSRITRFLSEVLPYSRYVMQSGFGLFLVAFAIAATFGYGELLRDVPDKLQAGLIGAVAVAITALWTPLRTYLQQADTVFLLPMERAVIRDYMQPALRSAAYTSIIRTLVVYIIFLPLYIKAPQTAVYAAARPLWLIGILFAALAAWSVYGAWQERRMIGAVRRRVARAARAAATLLLAWGLLNGPLWPAISLTAFIMLLGFQIGSRTPAVHMPWERLVREEARTLERWRRFLSWFVDVPTELSRPIRRNWAARLGERIPWERNKSWHYWMAKTFARGDTFGAWIKWHLVIGVIMIIFFSSPLAVWVSYAIGCAIGGIQLTELAGMRQDPVMRTLPLRPEDRGAAAAAAARRAGIAGTAMLWLLAVILQGIADAFSWAGAALLAGGLVWNGWLIPRRFMKTRDEEDDS